MCALREDRETAVLPGLREVHAQVDRLTDDLVVGTQLGRRFHELMVTQCGNDTLIVMVGALEALWAAHQQELVHLEETVLVSIADDGDRPIRADSLR